MTFDEFHASVTKQMPDAVKYPEMYDLCYRLMKLTWDAAKAEEEGWEDRSAMWAAIRAGKDVPDLIVTTGTDYENIQPKPFSRYAPRSGPR